MLSCDHGSIKIDLPLFKPATPPVGTLGPGPFNGLHFVQYVNGGRLAGGELQYVAATDAKVCRAPQEDGIMPTTAPRINYKGVLKTTYRLVELGVGRGVSAEGVGPLT